MTFRRFVTGLFLSLVVTGIACAQGDNCQVPLKAAQRQRYDEALEAYRSGRYTEAYDLLRRVAKQQPRSADVQFWLGMCSVRRDNNPAAIRRYFTRAAQLCDSYPDARLHFYMGVIHYSDDRFDDAVTELNRFFEMANATSNADYDAVYVEASNYLYWSQFLAEAHRNQAPFDPHAVRGVSTADEEMMPYLTHDGQVLYFLRETAPRPSKGMFYNPSPSKKVWQLCSSRRRDTVFEAGAPLPEPFNRYEGEGSVSVTADGNELFYSVMRYASDGYANVDIYSTRRKSDGSWTTPESVGNSVNGVHSWESQPSVSPDGQTLYFASNRKGGIGGIDIWRCRRNSDGTWGRAENLGNAVNTPLNEKCPHLHADGQTLYFASNGWQGFGGYDLYFIRVGDTYLQRPTNMGLPINSEGDDICLGVTADGRTGYYAQRDIYRFDLYPAARPVSMRYVETRLCDASGRPLAGTVTVRRDAADAMRYRSDSATGHVAMMLSQQHDNEVVASADGYMPLSLLLTPAAVRRGGLQPLTLQPLATGQHYPLGASIDAVVELLLAHPAMHIVVEAPRAAEAQQVYEQLLQRKLRRERLSYRGGTDIRQLQITITQM